MLQSIVSITIIYINDDTINKILVNQSVEVD